MLATVGPGLPAVQRWLAPFKRCIPTDSRPVYRVRGRTAPPRFPERNPSSSNTDSRPILNLLRCFQNSVGAFAYERRPRTPSLELVPSSVAEIHGGQLAWFLPPVLLERRRARDGLSPSPGRSTVASDPQTLHSDRQRTCLPGPQQNSAATLSGAKPRLRKHRGSSDFELAPVPSKLGGRLRMWTVTKTSRLGSRASLRCRDTRWSARLIFNSRRSDALRRSRRFVPVSRQFSGRF